MEKDSGENNGNGEEKATENVEGYRTYPDTKNQKTTGKETDQKGNEVTCMGWLVVYCDKDGKQTGEKKWDTKEQARKYAVRLENIGWVVIQIKKA